MITLVCLLEELSAKEMLNSVLKRILPMSVEVRFLVFEGKQDLDRNLERRIKGWNTPKSLFLIVRDKDSADCIKLKKELVDKLVLTGKLDKCCVRIACHELEAFYLGDLLAVEKGLDIPRLGESQKREKFRNPDSLANASEELKKVTKKKYQKVLGSKAISPYLKLDGNNKSQSFNILVSGIKRLITYYNP